MSIILILCSQDLPYWNVDEMHEIILLYSCLSFVFVHWNSSCSHYLKHLFLWNFNTCQKFIDWWILLFIRILALVFFSEHLAIDPFSSASRAYLLNYIMQFFPQTALQAFLFSCLYYLNYIAEAQEGQDVSRFYNCNFANNFTSGSTYSQNLNLTLSSLASNASVTGFYNTTVGQNLDAVYGLVLCRCDLSKEDCQTCANTASKEITQLCSNQKEAFVGYEFCSLRYSDQRFFSTVATNPIFMYYNVNNATEPVLLNRQLGNLVRTLSSSAASSPLKFAIGSINYTDFVDIHSMLQCTRDLAENSCFSCLQDIIRLIPQCCNGKQGGRVISMSCNLRFEIYPFFSLSLPPPPSQAMSPPSTTTLLQPSPEGYTWFCKFECHLFQLI